MSDITNVIRPRGSATGPGWQYRLERAEQFTPWVDWDEELELAEDPAGGAIQANVNYWLYARNSTLPATVEGSSERPLAAAIQITDTNRVVSVTPDGVVPDELGHLMELVNNTCAPDLNVITRILLNSMDAETQALFCQKSALCTTTPAVPNFVGGTDYVEIDEVVVLPASYVLRFDGNDCVNFYGWCVDKNHPNEAPQVRITRDGVVVATVTATITRTDVRDYLIAQGILPQGSTYAVYGWRYDKPSGDSDGQPHTYRAFGGESNTEATSDVGAQNQLTCGGSSTPAQAVRIVDLWVLTADGPTPTNDFRITKADGTTSLANNEGGSITVILQRKYSDGNWQPYAEAKTWSLIGAPTGTAITSGGVISTAADSITANANATVKVVFMNNLEVTAPLAIINQGLTATNNFRIVNSAGNTTLSTNEGVNLQAKIQRQYSDNSWLDDNTSRVWQATNNLPAGISINSSSGLLTVGENTISQNLNMVVYATLILANGTQIPLESPVAIINIDNGPTPTAEYRLEPVAGITATDAFTAPGTSQQLMIRRKWSDNTWRDSDIARSWSIVGSPAGFSINSRGVFTTASSVTTAQYVTVKAMMAGGIEKTIQLHAVIKGTSFSDKRIVTDAFLDSAKAYKGRTSQLLMTETYYGVGGILATGYNPNFEYSLDTSVPSDITTTVDGLLTVPQNSSAYSISVKFRPVGTTIWDYYTVNLETYVAQTPTQIKVDYEIGNSSEDASQAQVLFYLNSDVIIRDRIYESNVLYLEQDLHPVSVAVAGVGYNRIGGIRVVPRSTALKHEFYRIGAKTPFFTYQPTIPTSGSVARTTLYPA